MARRRKAPREQIAKAADLYVQFSGEEPSFIDKIRIDVPRVMLLIGECDGVLYTTRRDGRLESYIHRFKKRSRPLLTTGYDGKTLFIVGGRYDFTDAGIVDK